MRKFAVLLLVVFPVLASAQVTIPVGSSIQAAIGANPAGTVFTLPAGIWHQQQFTPKIGNQFIGDPNGGTILSGDDVKVAIYGNADQTTNLNVLFKNIVVEHYGIDVSECYTGAIHGAVGWIFDHAIFRFNNCAGLVISSDSKVIGGRYTDNRHAGIQSGGGKRLLIEGAEIARNNTRHDDINWDSAGIKIASHPDDSVIRNNWVHDNFATGIWCDILCSNLSIEGNTVINNDNHGIHYEISEGPAVIRNNVVNNNAGIQIFLSESGGAEVYDNNVLVPTSGAYGIFMQTTTRSEVPAGSVKNNTFRNNTVTFVTGVNATGGGITGLRVLTGAPVGAGNSSNSNSFYAPNATDPHWSWTTGSAGWTTYLANNGQDTNSTRIIGNGSVAGCQQMDCTGSGWPPGLPMLAAPTNLRLQ